MTPSTQPPAKRDRVVAYLSSLPDTLPDECFLRTLAARHEKTYFVTFAQRPPPYAADLIGVELVHLYERPWPFDNPERPVYSAPMRFRLRLCRRYYAAKLARWLAGRRVDVLHSGWLHTDSTVAALSGFHPSLVMPWGSDVLLLDQGWRRRNLGDARRVLRHADAFLCDNEIVWQRLQEVEPTAHRAEHLIMPRGVDLRVFCPAPEGTGAGTASAELRIIAVKKLIANSDFGTLLDGVADARAQGVPLRVEIYGDGEERGALEARIEALSLSDHVRLCGQVDNQTLVERYRDSDLYVVTSRSDGTSVAMIEAMACGLPVVTTDLPSYRRWVEERVHGWRFHPGDAGALAGILRQAHEDRPALRRMGAEGIVLAQREFDWHRNFSKLEDLYDRLCGAPR